MSRNNIDDQSRSTAQRILAGNVPTVAIVTCAVVALSVAFVPREGWVAVILHGFLTMGIMMVWYYWAHRLLHHPFVAEHLPFARMHVIMHHDAVVGQRFGVENAVMETLTNLSGLAFLVVPWVRKVLYARVAVFFILSYTLIHMVTYHTSRYSGFHRRHHEDPRCNFGISLMDAVFDTTAQVDQEEPEDISHYVFVTLPVTAAVLLCLYLVRTYEVHRCVNSVFQHAITSPFEHVVMSGCQKI